MTGTRAPGPTTEATPADSIPVAIARALSRFDPIGRSDRVAIAALLVWMCTAAAGGYLLASRARPADAEPEPQASRVPAAAALTILLTLVLPLVIATARLLQVPRWEGPLLRRLPAYMVPCGQGA